MIDNTLDSLNKARTARPVAGSSRKGNNPILFLVGNSTMRTGTLGNGNNGQWGWTGKFSIIPFYVDICPKACIQGFPIDSENWFDVGKPETLAKAEAYYASL